MGSDVRALTEISRSPAQSHDSRRSANKGKPEKQCGFRRQHTPFVPEYVEILVANERHNRIDDVG